MNECIKRMDYFGYTPQFLISGEEKYMSKLGGFTFLIYLIFALYYIGTKSNDFIQGRSKVDSSRDILKYSVNSTLNVDNFYFGVGLIDINYMEYNLSTFPEFVIYMMVVSIMKNGTTINTRVPLSSCDLSLFTDIENFDVYSEDDLINLQNKINYYLCPEKNFSMLFTPKLFGDDMSYLQINLDFANTSVLETADDTIIQLKPKLNFMYKNIFIDTQNKTHPYYEDIDSYWSGIDYETSKKTEFSLDPFEIWDDDNILGSDKFKPTIQTNVSNNSRYYLSYFSKV